MNIRTIKEDVFRWDITVVYNCSVDEMRKFLYKVKSPDAHDCEGGMYGAVFRDSKGWYSIVYLANLKNIPAIAHEALHLVLRICHFHGIPVTVTPDNYDETAAYLLEFYMKKILSFK